MQANQIPVKFQLPFAQNAASGNIQSPIPLTAGTTRASLTLGFPPATFTPIAAGGTPPQGADFNGILNQITAWLQWMQAGGAPAVYDAAFQTNVGGYPNGAYVVSATTQGLIWISTADNNLTNPDTGGVGWTSLTSILLNNAALTGNPTAKTQPVNDNSTKLSTTAYADRSATNAGAVAQANAQNYAQNAANVAQANAQNYTVLYADPLGSATTAQNNAQAYAAAQVAALKAKLLQVSPALVTNIGSTIGSGTSTTVSVSFTAPCAGYVVAGARLNVSIPAASGSNITSTLSINGNNFPQDQTQLPQGFDGYLLVASGANVTVTFNVVGSLFPNPNTTGSLRLLAFFLPNPT